ncbi:hypothetical protein J6590_055506 [Homalodisca vitripennis]|nr:hypothetical protein J6590_055506 [Homalodisca vitripennis]
MFRKIHINTFSAKRDRSVPPERLGTIHGCARDLSVPLGIVVLLSALFRQHCKEALSDSVSVLGRFTPDPTVRHTTWALFFGGGFTFLSVYAVNQNQVQRYMTMKDHKTAVCSLWFSLAFLYLLLLTCGFAGLCIFSAYYTCDPVKNGRISSLDQLMPLFVIDKMGQVPGLPGLFTAGIFSASLSTVSSCVNSLAAVTVEDYLKPLLPSIKATGSTALTKSLVLLYGLACLGVGFLAQYIGGLLQAGLSIMGIAGGPLLGTFTLGMFLPAANEPPLSPHKEPNHSPSTSTQRHCHPQSPALAAYFCICDELKALLTSEWRAACWKDRILSSHPSEQQPHLTLLHLFISRTRYTAPLVLSPNAHLSQEVTCILARRWLGGDMYSSQEVTYILATFSQLLAETPRCVQGNSKLKGLQATAALRQRVMTAHLSQPQLCGREIQQVKWFLLCPAWVLLESINQPEGALAGILSGIISSAWIGFGQPKPKPTPLPLSTASCLNMTTALPTTVPTNVHYPYMYRLSYLLYVVIGCCITLVVGCLVSRLAVSLGYRSPHSVSPDLLTPIVAKCLREPHSTNDV